MLCYRERNRQHAKRSRQRKREYLDALEQSVAELKAENEKLFKILGVDSTETKAAIANEGDRAQTGSTERFIAALQKPENRVLSDAALASLRELF